MTRRMKLKIIITISVLEQSKMVVNDMHYYYYKIVMGKKILVPCLDVIMIAFF